MTRFSKIFLKASGELPTKQQVFTTVLKELNAPLTGLKPVRNGYQAYMEREEDLDKLLTKKAQNALKEIGLETKIPPKIKCQRSIICRQIDSYVGNHTAEEICQEINNQNKNKAVEIIKFRDHTHLFKIEFLTTEMATAALTNGILCFSTRITPNQMEKERHTDVLMCFTCFMIEDHISANCPTPNKVICSECSGSHFFKDCQSETKKCLNCHGPHRTMAMACPKKKEAIKKKREEEDRKRKEKEEMPLSKIVQKTAKEMEKKNEEKVMSSVLGEAGLRAMIIVMDAHVHNILEPGSYNNRLNETLKQNNIEPINLPPNIIKSDKLIQTNAIAEKLKEQYATHQTESSPKRKKSKGQILEKEVRGREDEEEEMEDVETENIPDLEDITEDDAILDLHLNREGIAAEASLYNLKIVTTNQNLQNQTPKQLKELYKQGKIKYIRGQKTKISNRVIEEILLGGRMHCNKPSILYMNKAKYKEIKNGREYKAE